MQQKYGFYIIVTIVLCCLVAIAVIAWWAEKAWVRFKRSRDRRRARRAREDRAKRAAMQKKDRRRSSSFEKRGMRHWYLNDVLRIDDEDRRELGPEAQIV